LDPPFATGDRKENLKTLVFIFSILPGRKFKRNASSTSQLESATNLINKTTAKRGRSLSSVMVARNVDGGVA
jgi:hypothetical protein